MEFTQREKRVLDAPILDFDLKQRIAQLKGEKQWETEKQNAITLLKTKDLTAVLMILQQGDTHPEHSTDGPVTITLLSGDVELKAEGSSRSLKAPALVSLYGGIPHSVYAITEAAYLLTLVPTAADQEDADKNPRQRLERQLV